MISKLNVTSRLSKKARRFREDERGAVLSLETVFMFPLLVFIMMAMFVYYRLFSQDALLAKASYVVSDIISREETPVNATYLDNMHKLLGLVSRTQTKGISMRVTSVKYNGSPPPVGKQEYEVIWSQVRNGTEVFTPITQGGVGTISTKIPLMSKDDSVLVVETMMPYTPPLNNFVLQMKVGLGSFIFHNLLVVRPRFVNRVCWITSPC